METTRLTSKGQVVIPKAIRDRLKVMPGTELAVTLEGGRIVLNNGWCGHAPTLAFSSLSLRRKIRSNGPHASDQQADGPEASKVTRKVSIVKKRT